jgi:hypothetical protein
MSRLDPCKKPTRRSLLARTALVLAAAGTLSFVMLSAGACGTSSGVGGGGDTVVGATTSNSVTDPLAHPTGSNQVVLRVTDGGGFVPVEYNLTATPEFTLYGDGRVIVSGPVIAIYPGPALPNLQTTVISEEAMSAILSAAQEAGLLQNGVDYGQPGITDVSTTTFVVNVGGNAYQSSVYALGMEAGASGLTMAQQQARAALQDFRSKLTDLTAFVSDPMTWSAYAYEALAVYSQPVDATASTDTTDLMPGRLDWPLGDLSTLGTPVDPGFRRVVVSGQDLDTLQQKPPLTKANAITLWTSAGRDYHLYFRPLLPDEKS